MIVIWKFIVLSEYYSLKEIGRHIYPDWDKICTDTAIEKEG